MGPVVGAAAGDDAETDEKAEEAEDGDTVNVLDAKGVELTFDEPVENEDEAAVPDGKRDVEMLTEADCEDESDGTAEAEVAGDDDEIEKLPDEVETELPVAVLDSEDAVDGKVVRPDVKGEL